MPYVYEDSVLNPNAGNSASDLVGPYFLDRATARTSDVLREQFAMAFEENPVEAIRRWHSLSEDQKRGRMLSKVEADQRLGDVHLTGHINVNDSGISEEALKTLIFRKQVELQRQEIFSRSRGGVGQGVARLGVAFATAASDPINVGLSFVPIVGQAKYLRWLQLAKTPLARAGVRAGVGAIEGAAGAAMVEPLIYGSRRAEQADYGAVDSLTNVAFGTLFGAALHPTVGGIADVVGSWRRAAEAPPSIREAPPAAPVLPEVAPRAREWRIENISSLSPEEIEAQRNRINQLMEQPENAVGDRAIALDYLTRALNDEDLSRYVVINEKGEIVAAASFEVREGVAHGENLGSIEAGAAKRLVKELKARAEELGFSAAQFEARPGSERFHERMGFREEGGVHRLELGPERQGHIERTREAVGQAVTGERIDVAPQETPRVTEPEVQPVVREAVEETPRAEPTKVSEAKVAAQPKGRQHGEGWFDFATRTAAEQGFDDTKLLKEVYQANLKEGMGQKEAALEALEELGLDTESAAPTAQWSEEVAGTDPEVPESIRAAEEIEKEIDSDPMDSLDEDLANAESDLSATEKKYDIEEPDEELEELDENVKKANNWARASEVATDCLLRGV